MTRADVFGEILDDGETALDSTDGIGCHGGTALSRESLAAFLHELVLAVSVWLARDAVEVDRFAGGVIRRLSQPTGGHIGSSSGRAPGYLLGVLGRRGLRSWLPSGVRS